MLGSINPYDIIYIDDNQRNYVRMKLEEYLNTNNVI